MSLLCGRQRYESAATILVVGGLLCLSNAAWIPAKARLAQGLIERAWFAAATIEDPSKARPWPWADTWPVARLIRADAPESPLYVLAGASGEALAFGPGHLSSSAAPGSAGHVVIAGHRDTHFAFLRDLEPGAAITLETHEARVDYLVTSTEVVHESRTDLVARSGRAELTLLTCFPFDAIVPGGPLRYLVRARAVDPGVSGAREARGPD